MGKIRMLTDIVASQVAAGEVVERPASVVKELIENSIDAGARSITVEFSRGGTASMIISDDGSGMDREDALLCLERHATSKIRKSEDLLAISTMGFRGEALPSIASVSKFRLATCEPDATSGTEVNIQGGRVESVRDCGQAPGTRIEVRSLFFNIPARKKFLRAEATEAAHIVSQVQILALANPGIAFSCFRDEKQVFRVAATKDAAVRLRELFGAEFLGALMPFAPERNYGGITVSGFIAKPSGGRRDRSHQYTFLNGRPISSPAIQHGLRDAYPGAMEKGLNPPVVLYLQMDASFFDCNVHPAKKEVRFRNTSQVQEAIGQFAMDVLARQPDQKHITAIPSPRIAMSETGVAVEKTHAFEQRAKPLFSTEDISPEPVSKSTKQELPFTPLSLLGAQYLLLEKDGGLVIADLRAASERISYERILGQMQAHQPSSQKLLFPALVELQPKDYDWVHSKQDLLASAGILLESFGTGIFKVEGLPDFLSETEPREVIYAAIDAFRTAGSRAHGRSLEDALARSMSSLIRARFRRPAMEEAIDILHQLLACDLPYACPSGKPTLVEWSRAELDRKFGHES
ncbi:MAG: DNA mismatch repair endonuclease MutL [Chthoniobacterales bacterium]